MVSCQCQTDANLWIKDIQPVFVFQWFILFKAFSLLSAPLLSFIDCHRIMRMSKLWMIRTTIMMMIEVFAKISL